MSTAEVSLDSGVVLGQQMLSLATSTIKLAATFLTNQQQHQQQQQQPQKHQLDGDLVQYSLAQVALHSSSHDCWIIIRDKVYDVTSYVSQHPGGYEIIMEHAGRDATLAFRGVRHSADAIEDMEAHLIGILPAHERMYINYK